MNLHKSKPIWLVLSAFVVVTSLSVLHGLFVYWVYSSYIVPTPSIPALPALRSVMPRQLVYSLRLIVPLTGMTWILLVAWNRGHSGWARLLGGLTGSVVVAYVVWNSLPFFRLAGLTPQQLAICIVLLLTTPHMCWALLLLAFGLFAYNPRPVTLGVSEVK